MTQKNSLLKSKKSSQNIYFNFSEISAGKREILYYLNDIADENLIQKIAGLLRNIAISKEM